MLNIYGDTVKLTAAQKREYIALLRGAIRIELTDRRHRLFDALVSKGLVKVVWAWGNATRFERWI